MANEEAKYIPPEEKQKEFDQLPDEEKERLIEQAHKEALDENKKRRDRHHSSEEETKTEEEREQELIENIKQMIVDEKVAHHSPNHLLDSFMEDDSDAMGTWRKWRLKDLKDYFRYGILSSRRIRILSKSKRAPDFKHGGGLSWPGISTQEDNIQTGRGILSWISWYIENKKTAGFKNRRYKI